MSFLGHFLSSEMTSAASLALEPGLRCSGRFSKFSMALRAEARESECSNLPPTVRYLKEQGTLLVFALERIPRTIGDVEVHTVRPTQPFAFIKLEAFMSSA